MPNIFKGAGLNRRDRNDGVTEPVAWILGGDLNLTTAYLHNELKKYQRNESKDEQIHVVDAGSMIMRHGDFAMAQHMQVFQTSSQIGRDFEGVSDAHNMVVVVAKMVVGAAKPNSRSSGDASSLPTLPVITQKNCWRFRA